VWKKRIKIMGLRGPLICISYLDSKIRSHHGSPGPVNPTQPDPIMRQIGHRPNFSSELRKPPT
jgi:hypothetical protein